MGGLTVALHTDQLWFSAPGGIGTYIRELLRAFSSMEGAPELVTFQAQARPSDAKDAPDVEVPGSVRSLYPRWALAGRPALPEALAGCAVLHATNHAAVPPAAEGQALVATVHDLAFERFPDAFPSAWRWLYRAGVRAAIKRATVLLVPSQATADDLVERGADAGKIRVTPLAASLSETTSDVDGVLARLGISRPYVLCPGTLEPRKNQLRTVRAFRQVAPDVPHSLVLAGPEGWRSEEQEAELSRPGPGTIVRTGRLSEAELDAVYRGADLVVYVSLYEGFGLPVVEAMARGVPVLASTTPAVAGTAGDAARLVDPLDVAGIAEALGELLTDEGLRATLAAAGRERAGSFSWERTARATLDAYREAAERVHA
jgi:glycosyltransferase involved in cell wall biosynthesis